MNITRVRLIVTVLTTDQNPASVAASVDSALSALTVDKHRVYLADSTPVGNEPTVHEVPDEPFEGKPDNDSEMAQHDAWVNDHLYPILWRG